MNSSRYIVARLLLAFGLARKKKRLMEAADEMHLLSQAEEILGEAVWERVEKIEAISTEYWNLRRLKLEVASLQGAIQEADAHLNSSHELRQSVLSETNVKCQELEEERDKRLELVEQVVLERNQTIASATQIKRKFEASKAKIHVLSQEGVSPEIIEAERERMKLLKLDFAKLKREREVIEAKIQVLNENVQEVEEALEVERKNLRDEASTAYHSIGKANQDVSKLTADVMLLEGEMTQYYAVIGRYVCESLGVDPKCVEISKEESHLVVQMQSLRSSIALNHKLISMAP